ncbi:hydrogenase nickel incorporation protein HypB [Methylicorpusculum oleiharenae]|uniref:hydrogenase nickel incorporation protein HypB n=1 Tax=Methylicorpusculum oleiharenae TaxID=1338687 RepID=UPI00135ABBE2|nr:hydrogenase nickel incorporation protein HypB [Methylicorpusculum oleiharenae]MCD2451708.1 hydrogenase nickel incorporation protein HypB [Methylicorpusculum oleiharenae]
MCTTCGCQITSGNESQIPVEKSADGGATSVLTRLMAGNDLQADHNRMHFDQLGVLVINLMSSPGSGKTALLEATIVQGRERFRMAVIEGDLETENDALRIRAHGVQAHQITTGSACHLDAHLVHEALHKIDFSGIDVLFIENVGNLVCPASFDLGHHLNVILLSVAEGDDKPAKYPVMFRAADVMLITKTDLSPYLDEFSNERAAQNLRNLANQVPIFHLSARNGEGIDVWLDWMEEQIQLQKQHVKNRPSFRPVRQPDAGLHATRILLSPVHPVSKS